MAKTTPDTRSSRGIYKMRAASNNGNGGQQFSLGVPREIGEQLLGRTFQVQVTQEGLLYTPLDDTISEFDLSQTSWATA